jgi:prepilin-type N-terminal cleavage/methylation domain-containing protein
MVELLMQHPTHKGRAKGFTLIEVMVSITILSVGLMLLGGVLVRSARSADAASTVSYQTAIMASAVARLDAIPFTQLAAGTVCTTVTGGQFPHVLCSVITDINPKLKQVRVRVTPTGQPPVPADSVMFERGISGNGTPLNTP